jgi:transketolase
MYLCLIVKQPENTMQNIDQLVIDTLRFLAVDAIEEAQSGHPGLPMGAAAATWVLWQKHLQCNPKDPLWPGRDRFILSAGHGSMLLYGLLHLFSYKINLEDIRRFRQLNSATAGHPEYAPELGIETTTGPLGQGFATGIGMAMAMQKAAADLPPEQQKLLLRQVYSLCGDGDLQEGVSSEAASLAGHLGLGNVIYLYDDNKITIDGPTELAFSENVAARFTAYGWHVQSCDGYDLAAIDKAISAARQETGQPSLICLQTHIGYGAPGKQDTAAAHGAPLGEEEANAAKAASNWPENKFHIPRQVTEYMASLIEEKQKVYSAWQEAAKPLAPQFDALQTGNFSFSQDDLPKYKENDKLATRAASGQCINAICAVAPQLYGGSADLSPSNNTLIKGAPAFQAGKFNGRNIHFGVREHAMAAIANGLAQSGYAVPYVGTFLVFSDYMRPAIRLAALMRQRVIYVFTHDSIGLGEDGPTHQPIEHLAALRAIPGVQVIRPADANETAAAWYAASRYEGPTALILSRQSLPVITPPLEQNGAKQGAYTLWQSPGECEAIVIASGSEVSLALAAAKAIYRDEKRELAVVSMASWEIFLRQDATYREAILPARVNRRLAVEAAIGMGWERFGIDVENSLFMRGFGASAPAQDLFRYFGFTAANLQAKIRKLLSK